MTALEHTRWEPVTLTDPDRVKAIMDPSGENADTTRDATITRLIEETSQHFANYLGRHLLQATRTETYVVPQNRRMLSLDAAPIDVNAGGVASILYDYHPNRLDTSDELDPLDYVVNNGAGAITFLRQMHYSPGYVRVQYTAGLAVDELTNSDETGVLDRYPDLAQLCELQVQALMERTSISSVAVTTVPGAKASYTGQYGLITEVRRRLDALRRVVI